MSKQSKKRNVGAAPGRCPSCGAKHDSNDRFCRECGTPLQGSAKPNGRPSGLTGLRAFGLAVIALAVVYSFVYFGRSESDQPPAQRIEFGDVGVGGGPAPGQPAAGAPALSGRAAADQLFNQAMYAYETGDEASAAQFIPMSLAAYRSLESIDLDGRYHVALLELAAERPDLAIAQADTMLAEDPDHLLGLSVTARAYEALGQEMQAVEYYRRFLAAYTPDAAASRTEYIDHAGALPARRDQARRYLEERGISPEGP